MKCILHGIIYPANLGSKCPICAADGEIARLRAELATERARTAALLAPVRLDERELAGDAVTAWRAYHAVKADITKANAEAVVMRDVLESCQRGQGHDKCPLCGELMRWDGTIGRTPKHSAGCRLGAILSSTTAGAALLAYIDLLECFFADNTEDPGAYPDIESARKACGR